MTEHQELTGIAEGTQLLLIRHGETQWNVDQRIQGQLDVPLTEQGTEQAQKLARWLENEPIDRICSSDLQRARVTAEFLSRGVIPIQDEPRVREARFGEWEGMTTREIQVAYPREFHAWRSDAVRNRPPGGETLEEMRDRCLEALRDVLPRDEPQTIAVVAHGGPVRVMVVGVLGLPMSFYPKIRVQNTAVARIIFGARGPILAGLNDTGHLREVVAAPSQPSDRVEL